MDKQLEVAFQKNKSFMYSAARSVGANHAQAQDAVSVATQWIMKMKDTVSYADEKKLRGLMCQAAKHAAMKGYHKAQLDHNMAEYHETSPMYKSVGDVERQIWVHQALAKLSELERFVAWKYYALENSLQEVCDELALGGTEWTRQNLHKFLRGTVKPKLKSLLMGKA